MIWLALNDMYYQLLNKKGRNCTLNEIKEVISDCLNEQIKEGGEEELQANFNEVCNEVSNEFFRRIKFENAHRTENSLYIMKTEDDYEETEGFNGEVFQWDRKFEFLIFLKYLRKQKGKLDIYKAIKDAIPELIEKQQLQKIDSIDDWEEVFYVDIFSAWLCYNIGVVRDWGGLTPKELKAIEKELED